MATVTQTRPIKKVYGETASLTSTASHMLWRPKYDKLMAYNAAAWRMCIVPKLARVIYYNASTYTDYTPYASDRNDATHVPLDSMAATHYLYLGVTEAVRGFYFNVDTSNKNDEVATLDWEYMSAITAGVATFTDVAGDSDGTDSSGDTLKQDGLYAFTLPSVVHGKVTALGSPDLYWYRFAPSATLSATIDLIDIIPAADTTNYSYQEAATTYEFAIDPTITGGMELIRDTADGTLRLTWLKY